MDTSLLGGKMENQRQQISVERKKFILNRHLRGGETIASLSREYGIHPVTIYNWKRLARMKKSEKEQVSDEILAELERLRKENKQIKKALADVSIDKSILQDANEILKKKYLEYQLSKQRKK